MKKLFLFILFIPLVAIAEPDVSPPRQTYDDLLHRLERHPALEAVRQQVVEQREGAAGAVGLPDPMLMLGINNYPADGVGGFDRFAMTSKSLGFVQQIPNSGIRAATSLAKEHLAAKAELAVDYTRQQLKASLAIALAEHARVLKQKTLLDKEMKLLQQEAVYWEGRLQSGDATLSERSRVNAEKAQLQARQATLASEKTQYEAELVQLVEEIPHIDLPHLAPLPWPSALEIYPVLLAKKDVQVARANEGGAQAAFRPNYQVGMTYAQRDNSGAFDGGDFVTAQVGVSVPLWSSYNQKPKLRSAQAGVSRAEAMARDVQRQWQQQLATQAAKLKEIKATEEALLHKKKAIELQVKTLRASYKSDGRLDMLLAAKRNVLEQDVQLAQLAAVHVRLTALFNSTFKVVEPPADTENTPLPHTSTRPSTPLLTGEKL